MFKNWIEKVKKWFSEAALRDVILAAGGILAFIFGFKFFAGIALGLYAEVKLGILKYLTFKPNEEDTNEETE